MRISAHPLPDRYDYGPGMEVPGNPLPLSGPADPSLTVVSALESQVLTDEEAARRARERYRRTGIPALEPDALVAPHLAHAERVYGSRAAASVAHIDGESQAVRDEGPLYVTSVRLLHLGRESTSIALVDINELAMADDRILVSICGARGLMLDVSEPRQFRVLIAAARAANGKS